MPIHRAHVLLPEDLVQEIDAIVGPRGRSAFLVETARSEVRRQKLLRLLESKSPTWKDKDHPEFANGAPGWVRKIRKESEVPPTRPTKQSRRTR
jgi:hypothetical protein